MKANPKAGTEVKPKSRYNELKQMLEERRREIQAEVQGKIRDVRAEASMGGKNEVFDAVESSDAGIQDDIEFALIQMKSETLIKINDALVRLEQQDYGNCFECGDRSGSKSESVLQPKKQRQTHEPRWLRESECQHQDREIRPELTLRLSGRREIRHEARALVGAPNIQIGARYCYVRIFACGYDILRAGSCC